jgi:hypothetical protein
VHAPHVAELAHGSVAQPDGSHCQSAQLPAVGPVEDPLWQTPLETQKPQPDADAHAVHVACVLHGSADSQLVENHDHSEHDPAVGPLIVPLWQVSVSPQNPQPLRAVQSPHIVELAHGSGGMQLDRVQFQSAHDPDDGPLEVPVMHVLLVSQKPHVDRPVHSSHVADELHASVVSHAKTNQSQSAHEPADGPKNVPAMQVSVASQKPQPLVVVQSPQVVSDAQRSRSVVHTPPSQASPAQQSASVVHVCDPVRHWHRPLEQSIDPQQSAEVVHVDDASEQQIVEVGDGRQLKPVQHALSSAHVVRAAPHIGIARQVPPVQVSPAPHSGLDAQHA